MQQNQEDVICDEYIIHKNKPIWVGLDESSNFYECTYMDSLEKNIPLCAQIYDYSIFLGEQLRQEKILKILTDEAQKNSNIVNIKKVIKKEEKNHLIIIMERCCGTLWNEWEKRRKYSGDEIKEILKQILKGYESFYNNQIVLQICPKNIFLQITQGKQNYKIWDKTCQIYENNFSRLEKIVVPVYAAPEINVLHDNPLLQEDFQIKKTHFSAIDIYSIGITMYQLYLGRFPFETTKAGLKNFLENLKINEFKIEGAEELDQQLVKLIESMIQYYPSKRITFQQLVQQSGFQIDQFKSEKLKFIQIKGELKELLKSCQYDKKKFYNAEQIQFFYTLQYFADKLQEQPPQLNYYRMKKYLDERND